MVCESSSLACFARSRNKRGDWDEVGRRKGGGVGGIACVSRGGRGDERRRDVLLQITGGLGAEPLFTIPADLDSTVADVKAMIERVEGTLVREQRLVLGSRRLGSAILAEGALPGDEDACFLEEALGGLASPGRVVDIRLLRMAPAWAEVMEGLKLGHIELDGLSQAERSDRDLVMAAVARCGSALGLAAEALRADAEVVRTAVRRDPTALQFAADELRDSQEIVLEAVRRSGQALRHASPPRRADRKVVLAAVENSWRALEHAGPELRGDKSFMLAAVRLHGSTLTFASAELKGDKDVVLPAVSRSGWALSCASEAMRADRGCVMAAVASNPAALDFAAEALRTDPQIAGVATFASGRNLEHARCGVGGSSCVAM